MSLVVNNVVFTMGKCVFNDLWLSDSKYSLWLRRDTDKHNAQCAVCKKTFKIGTMGIRSLDSHMQSEKHKRNSNSLGSSVNTITNYADSTGPIGSIANAGGNMSGAGAKPMDMVRPLLSVVSL